MKKLLEQRPQHQQYSPGDGDTPLPAFLFYNLLLGMGSGALSPVVVTSIQNAVEERYLGVASSLPGFSPDP